MKRLAIYQSAYSVEVRRMAAGEQFYAVLHDRECPSAQLWESRIYDDAEDAWDAGRGEWVRRALEDEAHDLRQSDLDR